MHGCGNLLQFVAFFFIFENCLKIATKNINGKNLLLLIFFLLVMALIVVRKLAMPDYSVCGEKKKTL